jgi:hypothetical protein
MRVNDAARGRLTEGGPIHARTSSPLNGWAAEATGTRSRYKVRAGMKASATGKNEETPWQSQSSEAR